MRAFRLSASCCVTLSGFDGVLMLHVTGPGGSDLYLEHLVLDVNGTLTDRGQLLEGVEDRLSRLRHDLALHVLSADTFGTAAAVAQRIEADFRPVANRADKLAYVEAARAAVSRRWLYRQPELRAEIEQLRQRPGQGVPVRERSSEASLRQRLRTMLDENRA